MGEQPRDRPPDRPRLDRRAVAERLTRLDSILAGLEETPGPTAQSALDAVSTLAEIYGEALTRVVDAAPGPLGDLLRGDELLRHLLVLHDIHPDPLDRRVERSLEEVRRQLRSPGGDVEPEGVELAGIEDGVARVRLTGGGTGCGSSTRNLELAVREAVLAAAPELAGVRIEAEPGAPPPALIPVDALLRGPTTAGGAR